MPPRRTSKITVTAPLTIDSTLGWKANERPNFHRAYGPSSKSYIRCWSGAATCCSETSIHPELPRSKLPPSSCLWRNVPLWIVLRRCASTLQPRILSCSRPDATSLAMKVAFLGLHDCRAENWKRFAFPGMSPSYTAELVVEAAFKVTSGASTSLEVLLYKRVRRLVVFVSRHQAPCIVPDGWSRLYAIEIWRFRDKFQMTASGKRGIAIWQLLQLSSTSRPGLLPQLELKHL